MTTNAKAHQPIAEITASLLAAIVLAITLCLLIVVPIGSLIRTAQIAPVPWRSLFTSLTVATSSSLLAICVGLTFAVATQRISFQFRILVDLLLLTLLTFPHFITAAALTVVFGRTGVGDILCTNCGFSGAAALIMSLSLASAPLSYFAFRAVLMSISPHEVDVAHVAGIKGWKLFKLLYRDRVLLVIPGLLIYLVSSTISDPVTPAFLAPRLSNIAVDIWFRSNAFDAQNLESALALYLAIPAFLLLGLASIFYYHFLSNRPLLLKSLRNYRYNYSRNWSRPVGIRSSFYTIIAIFAAAVCAIPILVIFSRAGKASASIRDIQTTVVSTMGVSVLTFTFSVLIAMCAVYFRRYAGIWFGWRGRRIVDLFFATLLFLPAASVGCGYHLAILWSHDSLSEASSGLFASLTAVVTSLGSALPLTYFLFVFIGPALAGHEYSVALVNGARPTQAWLVAALPKVLNLLMTGFILVFSSSAVMGTAVLWVSSPEVPLVLQRQFLELDSAHFAEAFHLSVVVSTVILLMTLALFFSLSGFKSSPATRREKST